MKQMLAAGKFFLRCILGVMLCFIALGLAITLIESVSNQPLLTLSVLLGFPTLVYSVVRLLQHKSPAPDDLTETPYGSLLNLRDYQRESFEQEYLAALEEERQWQRAWEEARAALTGQKPVQ